LDEMSNLVFMSLNDPFIKKMISWNMIKLNEKKKTQMCSAKNYQNIILQQVLIYGCFKVHMTFLLLW
jgi:hypothetical protein